LVQEPVVSRSLIREGGQVFWRGPSWDSQWSPARPVQTKLLRHGTQTPSNW